MDFTEHLEHVVVVVPGDRQDSFGQLRAEFDLSPVDVEDRKATQGLGHPPVTPRQFAELAGPVVGDLELGIGVAPGGDRRPESQLHLHFEFPPFRDVGETMGEVDPPLQEGDRLAVARTLGGETGRQLELLSGLLEQTGRLVVPGHLFDRGTRSGSDAGIQLAGDALMDGSPIPTQKRFICDLLDQDVLEDEELVVGVVRFLADEPLAMTRSRKPVRTIGSMPDTLTRRSREKVRPITAAS